MTMKSSLHPISKVAATAEFNVAQTADTDFLTADIEPTYSPSKWVIQIQLSAAAVINVMCQRIGGVEHDLELNGATGALTASRTYIFTIFTEFGFTYNFQVSADATTEWFSVTEVGIEDSVG